MVENKLKEYLESRDEYISHILKLAELDSEKLRFWIEVEIERAFFEGRDSVYEELLR